jgi:hypothetical protein
VGGDPIPVDDDEEIFTGSDGNDETSEWISSQCREIRDSSSSEAAKDSRAIIEGDGAVGDCGPSRIRTEPYSSDLKTLTLRLPPGAISQRVGSPPVFSC